MPWYGGEWGVGRKQAAEAAAKGAVFTGGEVWLQAAGAGPHSMADIGHGAAGGRRQVRGSQQEVSGHSRVCWAVAYEHSRGIVQWQETTAMS